MNRNRHFQPICHESRDLGYARERRERIQFARFLLWACLCGFMLGWGIGRLLTLLEVAR